MASQNLSDLSDAVQRPVFDIAGVQLSLFHKILYKSHQKIKIEQPS